MKTLVKMNFNPDIAKDVGTDAAIIFENICFWVWTNKTNQEGKEEKPSFIEDKWWTYNSGEAFSKQFTWLTIRQIWRNLKKLEENNYVQTGIFNKVKYDRTKWYSVSGTYIGESRYLEVPKSVVESTDKVQPIPNVNTNVSTVSSKIGSTDLTNFFLTDRYRGLFDKKLTELIYHPDLAYSAERINKLINESVFKFRRINKDKLLFDEKLFKALSSWLNMEKWEQLDSELEAA